MERNQDLILWILNQLKYCEAGLPVFISNGSQYGSACKAIDANEYDISDIYQHTLIMIDDGLIEAKEFERTSDGHFSIIIYRLTAKGYNFLKINKNRFQKSINFINVKNIVVGVLIGVASQVIFLFVKKIFNL